MIRGYNGLKEIVIKTLAMEQCKFLMRFIGFFDSHLSHLSQLTFNEGSQIILKVELNLILRTNFA
jgi:hypothetical protein